MVKMDLSPTITTGISFLLKKNIFILTEFFHLPEIIRDLPPVIESWIPRMGISQL